MLLPAAAAAQNAAGEPPVLTLPEVVVVATSPLPGLGIDRDKLPGTARTINSEEIARTDSPYVDEALFQRAPGMALSDPNGNAAAQALEYRGFAASPLQGTPQGLAVYLNGIRLNEAFGDTVNWDLIPTTALDRAEVLTNNPVFGLNALGGAVSLKAKDGFTFDGARGELRGGSYDRVNASAEYGVRVGDYAAYIAAEGLHDAGWRRRSPQDVGRGLANLGWRDERAEVNLIAAAATSSFGAAAATPIELLAVDRGAVFTTPQTTDNSMALVGLNAKYAVSDSFSLQGGLTVRGFRQTHVDGNALDSERCSSSASPSFQDHLCLQDDAFPRPVPVTTAFRDQFAILDQPANPIPCPPGAGNPCGATPYGTIDRTRTKATTVGGALQAATTAPLFGHGNNFVAGASIDHGSVNFSASSTLGFVNPDLIVTVNPAIPGNGAVIHTLGNLGIAPVNLDTSNTYYGLYALDTFDVTEALSATAGARFNLADLTLADGLGTSPDLNRSQTYTRLNPVTGLTSKLMPGLFAYAGYSEANRAPTPVELACANPARPCLLESFLVSDPPLKQVVARTFEMGLRDRSPVGGGRLETQAGVFRTDTSDDIITLASPVRGRGFFQNVPGTRRQGIETSVQYQADDWSAYASYSLLDATYRFTGDLPSANNPFADTQGNVRVVPGKRIPGLPEHQAKLGVEVTPEPRWKLGGDLIVVGSRYFIGDDANQNPRLPGYALVNLHTSYQLTDRLQLFALVHNLFDKRYGLFGTFFDPGSVATAHPAVVLSNHRAEVLGQPLSIYAGIKLSW